MNADSGLGLWEKKYCPVRSRGPLTSDIASLLADSFFWSQLQCSGVALVFQGSLKGLVSSALSFITAGFLSLHTSYNEDQTILGCGRSSCVCVCVF